MKHYQKSKRFQKCFSTVRNGWNKIFDFNGIQEEKKEKKVDKKEKYF